MDYDMPIMNGVEVRIIIVLQFNLGYKKDKINGLRGEN